MSAEPLSSFHGRNRDLTDDVIDDSRNEKRKKTKSSTRRLYASGESFLSMKAAGDATGMNFMLFISRGVMYEISAAGKEMLDDC